jgi:hypothetical protein
MTPPTVFKLWPLHGTPLFPLTSRLSHIITIYHIYIITTSIKVVDINEADRRASIAKSSSKSSKSDGILYYVSSLLELLELELGGEESSD